MQQLYLVDASIYVFRAWFSMDDSIVDAQGRPVNALYGFAHFLLQLLERAKPTHASILFDESLDSSFRNKIFPGYKANRDPAPDELKYQFGLCRQLCRTMGFHEAASPEFEADDLIGSIAQQFRHDDNQIIIVSRDKDLVQLLQGNDIFWDFADNRQLDLDAAETHYGIRPDQVADFLALAGDAADNIPGVKGVGKKTAQVLLQQYDSLEQIYENLECIPDLELRGARRARDLLQQYRDDAFMSQQLTRIKRDIPLGLEADDLRWQPAPEKVEQFFAGLGVGHNLAARFSHLV